MPAKTDDTVLIAYTGKLEDGSVFGQTAEEEPLELHLGSNSVIPGLEEAVQGMEEGESKTAVVEPDKAFGPFRDELVMQVDRSEFPQEAEIEVGQRFEASGSDGARRIITIVDMSDDAVTIDANHPLAGKALTFEIRLLKIVPTESSSSGENA